MKKMFLLISLVMIAAMAVSPVSGGMSGTSLTGIQIQNLSLTNSANVTLDLYNQTGAANVNVPLPNSGTLVAGSAVNVYMPSQGNIPSGSYAGVVSADQPMAAILRTDWSATGGAAIYETSSPAGDVIIPLVTYKYANQTSSFSVQNTDTVNAATDIVIELYRNGTAAPVKTLTNENIAKGTSKTYNLNDPVWGLSTTLLGTVKVKSATKLLAVSSFIDLSGSRAVSGFAGVPTSSAATTLYCPLTRANYYGDTGISIFNPNGSVVTATISFRPASGAGGPYVQTLDIPANSANVAFQGPTGNSRTTTTPALPAGTGQSGASTAPTNTGFYGSAVITSASPLIAVVNDTLFGASWAVKSQSTYNCMTASSAGSTVFLPLVRGKHLTTQRLSTGIQIQNTSGAQVTVSLELYNPDGTRRTTSEPLPVVISANGSKNIWGGAFANLPAGGWYGSGILKAVGGSIVATVSDEGFGSVAIDSANYNGFTAP